MHTTTTHDPLAIAVVLAVHYAARPPRADEAPTGAAVINGSAVPFVAEPAYRKAVDYDRRANDYALHLGGVLVGWARTQGEGDDALDALLAEVVRRVVCEGEVLAEVVADFYGDAVEDNEATNEILWNEAVNSNGGW